MNWRRPFGKRTQSEKSDQHPNSLCREQQTVPWPGVKRWVQPLHDYRHVLKCKTITIALSFVVSSQCAIAFSESDASPQFVVEGVIVQQSDAGMGLREFTFSVTVCGGEWDIMLIPERYPTNIAGVTVEGGRMVVPDYIRAVSDGKEFRVITCFTNDHASTSANQAVAQRGPGPVPFAVDSKVIELWYAYASHTYLPSNQSPARIVPIESASHSRLVVRAGVPGAWRLLNGPPGLPEEIMFYGPATLLEQEHVSTALTTPEAAHVQLRVLQTTNFQGLLLPLRAETLYNNIIVTKNKEDGARAPWMQSVIAARRFQPVTAPLEMPASLPGVAVVQDFRFQTETAPNPVIALTNRWLNDDVVRASSKGAGTLAHVAVTPVRIILLLVTVLPITLFVVWRLRQWQKQKKRGIHL